MEVVFGKVGTEVFLIYISFQRLVCLDGSETKNVQPSGIISAKIRSSTQHIRKLHISRIINTSNIRLFSLAAKTENKFQLPEKKRVSSIFFSQNIDNQFYTKTNFKHEEKTLLIS